MGLSLKRIILVESDQIKQITQVKIFIQFIDKKSFYIKKCSLILVKEN